MKKYFTKSFVILLVVVLTLIVTSGAMAGTKKGLDGAWEAIDGDDSYMVMTINSSHSTFMWNDFGATACGLDELGNPVFSWFFEGSPDIVGNTLTVEGDALCITDDPYYESEDIYLTLTYIKESDSIDLEVGSYQVTFSRIGKK